MDAHRRVAQGGVRRRASGQQQRGGLAGGATRAQRSSSWRGRRRATEGGIAKHGGRCRRQVPLQRSDLAALERGTVDPSSMRFAVLTKNVIMDAVAAQRAPWVRVLDAYGIARQRADAHPGPDPKSNRHGSLAPSKYDDCLHYCLPGVPDLYNGRLLYLLQRAAGAANRSADGAAGTARRARRWAWRCRLRRRRVSRRCSRGGTLSLAASRLCRARRRTRAPSRPPHARRAPRVPAPAARGGAATGALGEPLAGPPLLGFCSDFDTPAGLKRGADGGASRAQRRGIAEQLQPAAAARKDVKAALHSKKDRNALSFLTDGIAKRMG